LQALPNIVRAIKSRRMTGTGHIARMWEIRNHTVLVGEPAGRDHIGDLSME